MDQAGSTVEVYFNRAVRIVDGRFGEGYSSLHPELVGQLVGAMVRDLQAATFGKSVGELSDVIRDKSI